MCEEYYKTSILAELPATMSVYQAVIQEQVEINRLFDLMGRPGLFRETYEEHRRPRGFSFFVKPTRRQYDDFVQLLDKMLSGNINLDSFGDDVLRHRRVELADGESERQQKGSIAILEEWLHLRYPNVVSEELAAIIDPLRKVRRLRQKPAHSILRDEYDRGYYELQDILVWDVYRALNALRSVLISDDAASDYQPPSWHGRLTVKSY
jgi:hypothetical protein